MGDERRQPMQQLPLEISPPPEPGFDNFLPGSNAEALARVRALAQGTLPEAIVYLWGGRGSARTHLLRPAAPAHPPLAIPDRAQALESVPQHALFVPFN